MTTRDRDGYYRVRLPSLAEDMEEAGLIKQDSGPSFEMGRQRNYEIRPLPKLVLPETTDPEAAEQ